MKRIALSVLLISTLVTPNVHANRFSDLFSGTGSTPTFEAKNPIASLGPFAVGASFCQKLQSLSPILQAHSTVMWPVIGIPGITTGMVQNESVLFKICDYLTQLQQLDISGAAFHTARFLNELTGKKWDDHLNQADLMWNTSNMIYDIKGNGGFRKGAMTSAYVHKSLIDAADKTAKYWQKQNGQADPEGLESRQERQRKLQKIAQLSYNRAILSEATSCPEAPINKNYQKEYSSKVIPEQANIKQKEERIRYFQEQLMKMGADMIVDVTKLQEYKDHILSLVNKGFGYRKSEATSFVEREVATGKLIEKKGDGPGMPEAEYKKVRETVKYQTIIAFENPEPWLKMKEYEKQWEKFMGTQLLSSGTFGLFDGKKGRIEEKYRSYAFECSEQQLANELPIQDRNDARYFSELTKKQDECRKRLKVRENEVKSLMETYAQMMRNDIKSAKDSQAKIWTLESMYMKTNPIETNNPNNANATAKEMENQMKSAQGSETECRPQYTPGEMAKMKLELQNTNNAISEQIASTVTEKAVNDEIEREGKIRAAQEAKKQDDMDKQKILNIKESGSSNATNIKPDTSGAL